MCRGCSPIASAMRSVGRGFALRAGFGVEVAGEQRGQVAGLAVAEEQLLRRHRAGGVDIQPQAVGAPFAQPGGDFGIHVGAVVAGVVALLPDHALQRLQRGGLAILVDPAQQQFDDLLPAGLDQPGLLGGLVQPVLHLGRVAVGFDEGRQALARVGEQHVLARS